MRLQCFNFSSNGEANKPILLTVPDDIKTVGDLSKWIAHSQGLPGCAPVLSVDGFALPFCEPIRNVLREEDAVTLRSASRARSPTTLEQLWMLSSVAEERGARADALELRVAELTQQLAASSAAAQQAKASAEDERAKRRRADVAAVEEPCVRELKFRVSQLELRVEELTAELTAARRPSADLAAGAGVQPHGESLPSPGSCGRDDPTCEWRRASATDLSVGASLRYRLLVADAWRGCHKRSALRTACVVKLLHTDPPQFVLRHAGGVMDCLEFHQLLDPEVQVRLVHVNT